jgi:hypothetical protein
MVNMKLAVGLLVGLGLVVVAWLAFTQGETGQVDASPGDIDRDGQVVVAPGEIDLARSEGDLLAAEVLGDGRLSFAEYDRVVREFVGCVEQAGGTLVRPLATGARPVYTVEFEFAPTGAADANAVAAGTQALVDRCASPTYTRVNRIWSLAHQPSPELLRAARADFVTCLRAEGFAIPEALEAEGPLLPFASANLPAFLGCSARVSDDFGLPHFAG